MTGTAATIVLGFLLATAFASFFHLLFGGPAVRIVQYVLMSCLGFLIGHFLGRWLEFNLLHLGAINLASAGMGAGFMLLLAKWLWDVPARSA